jgi:hypothetical protein
MTDVVRGLTLPNKDPVPGDIKPTAIATSRSPLRDGLSGNASGGARLEFGTWIQAYRGVMTTPNALLAWKPEECTLLSAARLRPARCEAGLAARPHTTVTVSS